MELKYNYVFFGEGDYYQSSISDIFKITNTQSIDYSYGMIKGFYKKLFRFHRSEKINSIVELPFLNIWQKKYFKNTFSNEKPICFVFIGAMEFLYSMDFFKYIKELNPFNKLIFVMRDTLDVCFYKRKYITNKTITQIFDLILTIDELVAKKFGYTWFPSFASKEEVKISDKYPISDVFFAGKAKNRLPIILEIYDLLSSVGLKCDFYITEVPEENQISKSGIIYAKTPMPYKEMLYRSVNSKAILEIRKEGASSFTSRFFESVMYDKKLITNNNLVKKTRFYNERYIQLFDTVNKINPSFVTDGVKPKYNYEDDYSPIRMIELIDSKL